MPLLSWLPSSSGAVWRPDDDGSQDSPPNPGDGAFADIAFSQDVIARHARVEWYREDAVPVALDSLVPPRWSRRRPAAKDDMKSVIYLCCPVQSRPGWAYLTALTSFLKGAWDNDEARRLLPARQLDFQDGTMAGILEETHNLANWVVNYDELLDRRQLLNQGVRVIRYKQAATQGRSVVISSTASLDLLRQMVRERVAHLNLGLSESDLGAAADRFIADANDVSGDIVLRAASRALLPCVDGCAAYVGVARAVFRAPVYTGKRGRPRLALPDGFLRALSMATKNSSKTPR